ncbi:LacI family DNA-binding transcriptional regulator [Pelagicoccus mobilis]|uniref:LacI family DNA-binding transcriptional regulator n=1 Tax=Pelagicoccus mobilis TaxID=415221 RepID=A0A934VS75_9BACT|nr:LacI family DNA-binding transcriptional regulator [Pelagicoccus mobilis]MBK1878720.1 LacI family DNA-binding transcriptional regulator [Pelagicoccus mobilis]
MTRVTVRMVAEKAGVSVSTASLALRNDPRVSEDTRLRVDEVAHMLGYYPHPLLGSMMQDVRSGKKERQKLSIVYLDNLKEEGRWKEVASYAATFEGARRRAEQLGYDFDLIWARAPKLSSKRLSDILWNRGVDGIILGPSEEPHLSIDLDWDRFSTVAISYDVVGGPFHRVTNNHYLSIRLAVEVAKQLGYRRIGIFLEQHQNERVNNVYSNYMAAYNSKVDEANRVEPCFLDGYTKKDLFQWLESEKPDLVLGLSRFIYEWMVEGGVRVPKDVGFALLDRQPIDEVCCGVDQRTEYIGQSAVDLVTTLLRTYQKGVAEVPLHLLSEGRWHQGGTMVYPPDFQAPLSVRT